jgi:hypothetical protein
LDKVPNRVGNQVELTIPFKPRDEPTQTLDAQGLVGNVPFTEFDRICSSFGGTRHALKTPVRSNGSLG